VIYTYRCLAQAEIIPVKGVLTNFGFARNLVQISQEVCIAAF
jgi:hypothetical protein